jgi:hypothetical protein
LFAQVITVNVVTAEPTTPAKTEPNTAWLTTISGNMLPNHDTAFGTMIYPAEPIVKPSAQKIKIASPLDILSPSYSCTMYVIHYRAGPGMFINLIVNFYQALIIEGSILHIVIMLFEKYTIRVL